jgi:hypothetical protein
MNPLFEETTLSLDLFIDFNKNISFKLKNKYTQIYLFIMLKESICSFFLYVDTDGLYFSYDGFL